MSPEFEKAVLDLLTKIGGLTPEAKSSEDIMLLANTVDRLYRLDEGFEFVSQLLTKIMELEGKMVIMETEYKAVDRDLIERIQLNKDSIGNNAGKINFNKTNIETNNDLIVTLRADRNNPHKVTKTQVGLANVPNYPATSSVTDTSTSKFATANAISVVYNRSAGTGVPIGAVTHFMGVTAPIGWLIVEPSTIYNKNDYPELYAHLQSQCRHLIINSSTFRLVEGRGTFIRGYDTRNVHDPSGSSRPIGTLQGDAIRNITGQVNYVSETFSSHGNANGGFFKRGGYHTGGTPNSTDGSNTAALTLDVSRVVPTAPENRPKNINLLVIIKAFNSVS